MNKQKYIVGTNFYDRNARQNYKEGDVVELTEALARARQQRGVMLVPYHHYKTEAKEKKSKKSSEK